MKNLMFAALLGLSFSAAAEGPRFSAFTDNNVLYVTILGDCNAYGGQFDVAPNCKSDRVTRNLAPECDINLSVISTMMACGPDSLEGKVLTVKLTDAKVAPEARVLHLTYSGQTIDVQVNK